MHLPPLAMWVNWFVQSISILYWRCLHLQKNGGFFCGGLFQFSIGDAPLLYKRRKHAASMSQFQFSIGDAQCVEGAEVRHGERRFQFSIGDALRKVLESHSATVDFNSLLEMRGAESLRRRVDAQLISILYWRCTTATTVTTTTTNNLFQFSIGDARETIHRIATENNMISILYWRCG